MAQDVTQEIRPDVNTGTQPTTATLNVDSLGGVAWSNLNNVLTSDDVNANSLLASGVRSDYAVVTNFEFDIPTTASILGVSFAVEKSGIAGVEDYSVRLVLDNAIASGATDVNNNAAGAWPVGNASITYGGSNNLWGKDLSRDNIISTGFGVAIAAINNTASGDSNAFLDHVTGTVYYGFDINNGGTMSTVNQYGTLQRTVPIQNEQPSLSGVRMFYLDRFDDPRYYTGDTSS